MKKLLLLILVLFFYSCSVDDWDLKVIGKFKNTWFFDGGLTWHVSSSVLSNDGNVLIGGNYNDKVSVINTSVKGNVFWRKDYSIGSSCMVNSIVQTSANHIYICGETNLNYAERQKDIFLLKTNANGDSIWTKTFGGDEYDFASCLISTSDRNLLIAGRSESFGARAYGDIYLIKLNYNGEIIWEKTFPDPDSEFSTHIVETQNGDYIITGNDQAGAPDTANRIYLLKVDAEGNLVWKKKFGLGTGDWKWGNSTVETMNEDLITCGQLTTEGYTQVLILKIDKNGNLIWEKNYGSPYISETGYSIKGNDDNTFTVVGSSFDVNNPDTEIILFKIDENGRELWFQRMGASFNSNGFNLLKYGSKNIVTGNYDGKIFMSLLNDNGKAY